jgi:CHAD domain-containing protein
MPPLGDNPPAQPGSGSGPTTYREVERKLRVPDRFDLPELAGVVDGVARVDPGEPVTMLAEYHDTPDVRLIRWGATLRRRAGGPDEGWHLKLPVEGAGAGVRDELALPLAAGDVGEVPAEMADIVRSLVREAPLVHVSTVRTRRAPFALVDALGRDLAELVDDRVEVLENGQVVRSFHEIEVEARPGDGGLRVLDAVVDVLVARGAVPGSEGKAAAALGSRAKGAPDVVVPALSGPRDPAGEAVRRVLAANVRKLLLEEVRVRRDLPDSVHQMRVAARTLRSALRTFAPLVDHAWAEGLREELRKSADALGAVRDTEVLRVRLEKHADALPAAEAALAVPVIDAWLCERLADARAAALRELRSARHVRLLVDLVDAAQDTRLTRAARKPARRVLPDLVEKAARRLAKDVERLDPDSPAAQWHRARILAKRARYAAEAVAPVLADGAAAWGAAFERVTELLGDHQDSVTAQAVLHELADHAGVDGPTGYALGLLDGLEVERERADREAFAIAWPKVRRAMKAHPLR